MINNNQKVTLKTKISLFVIFSSRHCHVMLGNGGGKGRDIIEMGRGRSSLKNLIYIDEQVGETDRQRRDVLTGVLMTCVAIHHRHFSVFANIRRKTYLHFHIQLLIS